MPCVASLDELNTLFRKRCEAERDRVVQSLLGPFTIKDRLVENLAGATTLPKYRFDPCVIRPAVAVDKFQTVAFDSNRYSVPRPFAFQMVKVKAYVAKVVIVAHGQVVATHERSLEKHTMILDPIHYLATLGKKPGASTIPRYFATGSSPGASLAFVLNWNGSTARWAAHAGSCESYNCWANIRCRA